MEREKIERLLTLFKNKRHIPDLHSGTFIGKDWAFVECNLDGEFDILFTASGQEGITRGLTHEGAAEFYAN